MPELQRVRVNDVEFAYFEEGTGPLVLLCHGFPDTAHTWDYIRPALAQAGYRAVTPFMRGYAPTSLPPDRRYDSDTLGSDVLGLINALGDGQPAVLIGHDWGAAASFSAVGLQPEAIRLLITVGVPHPASLRPTPKLLWTTRHFFTLRFPGALRRMAANDFAGIDALVRRWSPGWELPAEETRAVKRSFEAPGCLDAALGYYRAMRPAIPKAQRVRVVVPAVAFAGLDDIIDPGLYDRAVSRYDNSYEVVRMPGSHFMHRQHPKDFERELLAVLRRHAPLQ